MLRHGVKMGLIVNDRDLLSDHHEESSSLRVRLQFHHNHDEDVDETSRV